MGVGGQDEVGAAAGAWGGEGVGGDGDGGVGWDEGGVGGDVEMGGEGGDIDVPIYANDGDNVDKDDGAMDDRDDDAELAEFMRRVQERAEAYAREMAAVGGDGDGGGDGGDDNKSGDGGDGGDGDGAIGRAREGAEVAAWEGAGGDDEGGNGDEGGEDVVDLEEFLMGLAEGMRGGDGEDADLGQSLAIREEGGAWGAGVRGGEGGGGGGDWRAGCLGMKGLVVGRGRFACLTCGYEGGDEAGEWRMM